MIVIAIVRVERVVVAISDPVYIEAHGCTVYRYPPAWAVLGVLLAGLWHSKRLLKEVVQK